MKNYTKLVALFVLLLSVVVDVGANAQEAKSPDRLPALTASKTWDQGAIGYSRASVENAAAVLLQRSQWQGVPVPVRLYVKLQPHVIRTLALENDIWPDARSDFDPSVVRLDQIQQGWELEFGNVHLVLGSLSKKTETKRRLMSYARKLATTVSPIDSGVSYLGFLKESRDDPLILLPSPEAPTSTLGLVLSYTQSDSTAVEKAFPLLVKRNGSWSFATNQSYLKARAEGQLVAPPPGLYQAIWGHGRSIHHFSLMPREWLWKVLCSVPIRNELEAVALVAWADALFDEVRYSTLQTEYYINPMFLSGEPDVSGSDDVYVLGTFYELSKALSSTVIGERTRRALFCLYTGQELAEGEVPELVDGCYMRESTKEIRKNCLENSVKFSWGPLKLENMKLTVLFGVVKGHYSTLPKKEEK